MGGPATLSGLPVQYISRPMEKDPGLDAHLAQVLERIGEVARALRWKQAVDADLSPLQIRILGFLGDHSGEGVGVARLAMELQVSRPTISDSVNLLAERKLVLRKADKSDGRSHALVLTAAGRKNAASAAPMNDALADLDGSRKEALLLGLMSLLEQLFRSGEVQVQRMCFTCAHYRGDRKTKHRCLLLEKTLKVAELRTDCVEHELTTG